jgi:valyl-tRNA synthetase
MTEELPPQYDPAASEKKIYELWEKSGYFNPDNLPDQSGEPYTIIMPPSNANAAPHVGHALGFTIQDILIRHHRMLGRRTLWLPGTDHAGFETQVVFEKKLEKEGRSRFQMTREEFYKETWDFVQTNKHITEEGVKRLGASCDWSRNIFTLDPRIVNVVYGTFEQMHKDGLIYRGNRICNWCTKHQTGLADLETKHEEREDPLYYIKYGPITLATVRPETKFGDTAIAVHPDDERYKQYIGKEIEIETLLGPAKIKVIADAAVDPAFGTGAVKVTPAHDATDFDIWQRHKDEIPGPIEAIDRRGKLTAITGPYAGMKVAEARAKVVEDMQAKGLIEKIDEKYKHNVQTCYKCNNVIEPLIVPQWYVAMTKPLGDGRPSLRDMAVAAVRNKEVNIVTERFEKLFMHWMENLRDWPISRQIVWGIPIPVKYCPDGHIVVDIKDSTTECPECGSKELTKDLDTFDTWFSSGQWPFATLQALGEKDFKTFFPTQVMETAWDIIFFWVARMIMMSYYRTGKPPFEKVLLHGLVRAADRQKMSKSKGNVVDPLGVIDTYGTDALRFALIFSTSAGNDIPLAEDKIKGMKHFANKVWNIARFVFTNTEGADKMDDSVPSPQTEADKAILEQLATTTKEVTDALKDLELHRAAQAIYDFVWYKFADIYIEASKGQLKDEALKDSTSKILQHVLVKSLTLLHPFMPFVTEEIYQKIKPGELLMIKRWPEA